MAVKSIIGIVIITLNLAGVCYMTIMALSGIKNKYASDPKFPGRTMEGKEGKSNKKQTLKDMDFNSADYLLDDIDLSEFDNLDLDNNQIRNQNQKDRDKTKLEE